MPFGNAGAGVAAVAWLLLLWFAAPACSASVPSVADRLRALLVLAVGIPFVLGFANLLFPSTLIAAAFALAAVRIARHGWRERLPQLGLGDLAALAVVAALVWPVAVRPVLDGDTLIYHLPNAASWIAAHGVWTTATRYWWYPPGSELAAAALWALAGPSAVGWAGLVPAALLLARVRACAREAGQLAAVGLALGCLVLAMTAARVELFSLQNDLWLATLVVEGAACAGAARGALALVKPSGIAFAALVTTRDPAWRRNLLWTIPFLAWVAHDALLWRTAAYPPGSTAYAGIWDSTIAAHLPGAFAVGARAIVAAGPCTVLGFALGFAALVTRERLLALGALVLCLCTPYGYTNPGPELATGETLRYGLPFVALGALALVRRSGVLARAVAAIAGMCVLVDVRAWWAVFAGDAATHGVVLAVALTVVVCAAIARLPERYALAYPLVLACGAGWCAYLVDDRAPAYLAGVYEGGTMNGIFPWLVHERASTVITLHLPSGAVALVAPRGTPIGDLDPATACVEIARLHPLVIARDDDATPCGLRSLFDDGRFRALTLP
jgi:hypothetical protein